MTIYSLLNDSFEKNGSLKCIKCDDGTWLTYDDVMAASDKLSAFLSNAGVPAGGIVVLDFPRGSDYSICLVSCMLKGYSIVPMITAYPENRKDLIVQKSKACYTLTKEIFNSKVYRDFCPQKDQIVSYTPKEDQIAIYIFTSGSTGMPKGVMLDQRCVGEQVLRNKNTVQVQTCDYFGVVAPFIFIVGIEELLGGLCGGAHATVVPDEAVRDPRLLADFYNENQITITFISPRVLAHFRKKGNSLRTVITASERVSNVEPQGYQLLNEYGQSELCGASLYFDVDKAYDNTPIGKPFDGLFAYVLDDDNNEVEIGELCLSGHFFSGYVDLPELTAKTLVPNPFRNQDGQEMMVRTGDIVKRLPDGNIEYMNRNDWMIKLNGQRIEPGEIENVIKKVKGVNDAAVKDFKTEVGQVYLCAYIVGDVETSFIRNEIEKSLPAYMIPAFFISLPELPKTASNKLDRLALKAPDASFFKSEYVAPVTDEQKLICSAFEHVLGIERVGIHDDFFAIGGDSIKTMDVAVFCEELNLPAATIFKGRTPEGISKLLNEAGSSDVVHSFTIPDICPMTDSQKGVFFECIEEPESLKYNIPAYIELPSGTDIDRYEKAVKTVFEAHPILSVTTGIIDNVPSLLYQAENPVIPHVSSDSIESEVKRFVSAFDLEKGPLYHFEFCHCKEADYFLFDIHHLVFDGTSLQIFTSQLNDAYNGKTIPEEKLSLFDLAKAEESVRESDKYREAEAFFDQKLTGTNPISGPESDVLEISKKYGAPMITLSTQSILSTESVEAFIRPLSLTENTLFLGAFAYTLALFGGEKECGFCSANSGRHDVRLKDSLGMFVRTLPLHYQIDDEQSIVDYLRNVQEDFFETISHDCISMGDMVRKYGIGENITFIYQSDLLRGAIEIDPGEIMSPIVVMVFKELDAYTITMRYYASRYTKGLIESIAETYLQVISQMMRAKTLSDIVLTSPKQLAHLDKFNNTESDFEHNKTVLDLFLENVRLHPKNVAVVYKDISLTYKEVDDISSRIAAYLALEGVGEGDTVSILIPRCEYMVIASLGVLKSGAAYQPLDPSYPDERLNFMVDDSSAKLVIADKSLIGKLSSYSGKILYTEDIPALPEGKAKISLPKPENLFILLYTSGSTGVPKGCMLEHRNISAFCAWYRRYYSLNETSRVSAYASYGFDACMMDMYPALTCGARVVIIPEDLRLDLMDLNQYFKQEHITHSFMTTQVGRQFATICDSNDLQYLSVGGEALAPLTIRKNFTLVNGYGPTECTIFSTVKAVDRAYKRIPIGKPVDNLKTYIVDKYFRRLPVGVPGELCLGGDQVSRGYLNRPEKTAEVYVDNPFITDPEYGKLYRTGDIVRMLPDGNLDYLGRNDGQVKIRGFRIELPEVEEIIRRFPMIDDVTVVAFDAPGGGKFIAAYIVSAKTIDIEKLNLFIGEEKPSYMIPAVTMQIDKIPLNQNQKVNRRALPVPQFNAAETDHTSPVTETEKSLFEITSKILGTSEFGTKTAFEEIGLTSITSIRLVTEIGSKCHIPIRISDLKQNNCIQRLAQYIDEKQDEEVFPVLQEYPLTKTQKGILAECMIRPDSNLYNIPVILELDSLIDTQTLKSAIVKAVNAHPYMLTILKMAENGEVMQLREETIFSESDIREEEKTNLRQIKQAALKAFTLIGGRLFEFAIFTVRKTSRKYMMLNIHHIISDGFSLNILLNDITRAYCGEVLNPETYSGFEVALSEQNRSTDNTLHDAKSVYDKYFADCDGVALPPQTVHGALESAAVIHYTSDESANRYKRFCEQNHITMTTLFNAAFAFTLGKFINSSDVTYCTVYNGRNDSRMASIVSMLVKTFPVRATWEDGTTVNEYLKNIENEMLDCMANDIYSFAEVSRKYNINADILFTYQGEQFTFDRFCGHAGRTLEMDLDASKAPIDIDVVIRNDTISIEGTYRSDMFDEFLMNALAKGVFRTVDEMICKKRLSDINIADEADIMEVDKHNKTKHPVPDEPVHMMFERQAELLRDSTAVIADDGELTYGELNIAANRLAHNLLKLGVRKDEIVGLIPKRGISVFVGELGILKAGGAFLPMVPEYPDDRIEYCIKDAGCSKIVVTRDVYEEKKALLDTLSVNTLIIEDMIEAKKDKKTDVNPNVALSSDSLCYCIYTSGSTGTPKGVMIEHRNLRNFLDPNKKNPETRNYVAYGSRVLSVISVSFDFSLMETLLPLCNGLSVCVASEEEIHDPTALGRKIVANHVDVMSCTPSLISNMIDIPGVADSLKNMRLYDFGAEAFPKKLYGKIRAASPKAVICNGYGPTEATISCISKVLDGNGEITIGKPAANVQIYICDKYLHELPIGAQGELVIGGKGVGRGYVNLPNKTAEVFVRRKRKTVYRSGDLARLLPNGEIEFFGRLDNQVKIRGFRVELDEIENNINAFPGIRMSKAIVRNNGKEDYLAAFFTAEEPIIIDELRDFLKKKLTYYMIPAAIMQIDEMPLTTNGKINFKALPEVSVSQSREYVAPKSKTEQDICDVYAMVLNLEKVGATEDFFEIGGTSLSVTNVVLKLMEMGYNVVYKNVFDFPSARELASNLLGETAVDDSQSFAKDFDYEAINKMLAFNTMEHIDEIRPITLGNIILTGANGFLGIHILKEYLEHYEGTVYCLLRKGHQGDIQGRLDQTYYYYFSESCMEKYPDRVKMIEGDVTDRESLKKLAKTDADLMINCAACVKHFVKDDLLDRVNVQGVKNLIDVCLESGKKLVQISTVSVGGMTEIGSNLRLTEKDLYSGQYIDNDYIRTKFLAERAILQAKVQNGLDGRIIRVGNLTSRISDGEFQMNFKTNSFMRNLKAFAQLGTFPMFAMNNPTEFSPVDSTAEAILRLVSSESEYTIFEAYNNHIVYMSDVINAMKKYGFDIKIASYNDFTEAVQKARSDEKMRDALLGLIAYRSNDETSLMQVESDNRLTIELLYRLGYIWPIIDNDYLYKMIYALNTLGFFDI